MCRLPLMLSPRLCRGFGLWSGRGQEECCVWPRGPSYLPKHSCVLCGHKALPMATMAPPSRHTWWFSVTPCRVRQEPRHLFPFPAGPGWGPLGGVSPLPGYPGPVYRGDRGGEGGGLRCPSCWSQAFRAISGVPPCAPLQAGPLPLVPGGWSGPAAWPPRVFSGTVGRERAGTRGPEKAQPVLPACPSRAPHRLLPRRTWQPRCSWLPLAGHVQVPWRGPFLCLVPHVQESHPVFQTKPGSHWTSL